MSNDQMQTLQQNQIVLTPAQLPPNIVMVPMTIPPQPKPAPEPQPAKPFSLLASFFWAAILLLALWFITGGYKALQ